MYKFLLLIILAFSLINGSIILSGLSFLLFLAVYTSYELFIVMVLIDGYMGAFYDVPWLSLGTGVLLILVAVIKKRLMLYTDRNEVAT